MNMGIYIILNCKNGKFYLGSSNDLEKRFMQHSLRLIENRHENNYLQNAYNKEPNAFEFIIIEETNNEILLLSLEQKWLDASQCYYPEIGYNIKFNAKNNLGMKWSEEHKKKISNTQKGKIFSENHVANIKLGLERSIKIFPNRRNKEKWPHEKGKRCDCYDCAKKRRYYKIGSGLRKLQATA